MNNEINPTPQTNSSFRVRKLQIVTLSMVSLLAVTAIIYLAVLIYSRLSVQPGETNQLERET